MFERVATSTLDRSAGRMTAAGAALRTRPSRHTIAAGVPQLVANLAAKKTGAVHNPAAMPPRTSSGSEVTDEPLLSPRRAASMITDAMSAPAGMKFRVATEYAMTRGRGRFAGERCAGYHFLA